MKIRFITCLIILFSAFQALADEPTEYFVHPDGGTLDQCDGTSSTPYSDSISNKECAVNHIFELLDPEYYTLNIKGGDVITIMNNTDGSIAEYEMGRHGKYLAEHCSSAYNYECHTPSIPSGSEENPTIIRGALTNGKCEIKPMLFGTGRAARIFTINDSQHIELSCLTITDKSSCIGVNHPNKDLICNAGHPYNKPFADKGLYIIDSKNIILRDLDIQGLGTGIHAGRLENISLFNVNIYANYLAGWDGDIGKGVSGNEGTMLFKDSSIIFNGCALIYDPSSDKHNKPHACARQDIGGYGDGLGTEKTGGDWIFDNTTVMYNSSDGIDLLYHHDGGDITVMNSRIEGNAGNQVKTSGNAVINNNIIISNCGWNSRQEDYLGGEGETCRAQGNALSLFVSGSDDTITLINNTVISEGDCIILTEAEAGAVPDNQKISIVNNILYGAKDFHPIPVENSCLHYTEFVFPTKQIHNNIIHMVKGYGSPCTDFNSEDIPDGDNANSGSCSIGNGVFDDSDHSITTNPRFEKLDLGIRHTNYDVASLKSEANKPYPINKNGPSYKKAYTAAVDGINMPDTDVLGHERGNEPDIGAVQSLIKSTPPATIEVTKIK